MALASFGFPGTNGFVGEALVMIGAFAANPWVGAAIVPGVMLGAAYMLRLGQKLAWGAPTEAARWRDLNVREWLYFAPLAVLVIYIGLAPGLTLRGHGPDARPGPDRVPATGGGCGRDRTCRPDRGHADGGPGADAGRALTRTIGEIPWSRPSPSCCRRSSRPRSWAPCSC